MNNAKKIANAHHEDDARRSSRDWRGRISKRAQSSARLMNRRAKKKDHRDAFRDQENN
jgi:hypothetical protein